MILGDNNNLSSRVHINFWYKALEQYSTKYTFCQSNLRRGRETVRMADVKEDDDEESIATADGPRTGVRSISSKLLICCAMLYSALKCLNVSMIQIVIIKMSFGTTLKLSSML